METETPRPIAPKRSSSFVSRLIKIIAVLVVVIIILLYLIFKFGLGGGNGSMLPAGNGDKGSQTSANNSKEKIETENENKNETENPKTNSTESNETNSQNNSINNVKIPIRFELIISFETDPANPDNVKEFTCNIEKIDTSKKDEDQKKVKYVVCNNMSDFEFAIEKEIRDWRLAFDFLDIKSSDSSTEIAPVLHVQMNPFPGEGVFRKIESIVRSIDSKISIMRSEN
jgi:hypothetical protein